MCVGAQDLAVIDVRQSPGSGPLIRPTIPPQLRMRGATARCRSSLGQAHVHPRRLRRSRPAAAAISGCTASASSSTRLRPASTAFRDATSQPGCSRSDELPGPAAAAASLHCLAVKMLVSRSRTPPCTALKAHQRAPEETARWGQSPRPRRIPWRRPGLRVHRQRGVLPARPPRPVSTRGPECRQQAPGPPAVAPKGPGAGLSETPYAASHCRRLARPHQRPKVSVTLSRDITAWQESHPGRRSLLRALSKGL